MNEFRPDHLNIEGDLATFPAANADYVVTLSVQRKDGKPITEREARLAYTEALSSFPQLKTVGKL